MKRVILFFLLASTLAVVILNRSHGRTGALQSGSVPSQPPPCPTCIRIRWTYEGTIAPPSSYQSPEQQLRRLEIPAGLKCPLHPVSVKIEILSPERKVLFESDDVLARFIDSKVVIELAEARAKAGARHFKTGNKLRITIEATPIAD